MSFKSEAIKFAKKKLKKTKVGKKVFKAATIGGLVVGGSLITLLLANEGKQLDKQKSSDN